MPLLDHNKLSSEQDWDRACLVLSAIGNGYVWQNGEDDPVKVRQGAAKGWSQAGWSPLLQSFEKPFSQNVGRNVGREVFGWWGRAISW